MECLITASLTLNISSQFSKLLNTSELELQMLNTPEKSRTWQVLYLVSPPVRNH